MEIESIIEQLGEMALQYGSKLLGAFLVLFIGVKVIKFILKRTGRMLKKSNIDATLQPFIKSSVGILLKILLVISFLGMVGIEMTSFIAILGAAGLAVGLALSGTLQNFAGGVIILIIKPFKVGDFIDAQGHMGTVKEIQIFNTVLKTPDNKTIIIPNGGLSTSSLTNFSVEAHRRVDFTFGIGYGDKFEHAKEILEGIITEDTRIFKDPEPVIVLHSLGDSSVNVVVRVWAEASNYWGIYFDTCKVSPRC
ncbi:MAG: mechanosensitive ion channel [Bacteroidales bacterium]|jgi:small conductance mechanosensitive channel|nr:mechanosensitive ion channel [Bacteroidales bacterium]